MKRMFPFFLIIMLVITGEAIAYGNISEHLVHDIKIQLLNINDLTLPTTNSIHDLCELCAVPACYGCIG